MNEGMLGKKKGSTRRNLTLTADDLKGKQSVRATFRLPPQIIELLSVIAGQLGIKQKSLFDQLVENGALLEQVAREALNYPEKDEGRHQKTFVISRSTLINLNKIARDNRIPRDILVEAYIKQLLPVIETELGKHRKRKMLLKEMKEHLRGGKKLLKKTGSMLGIDDPLYEMIANQITIADKNITTIENMIRKGMPMEDW
jgi:hypothetical protein